MNSLKTIVVVTTLLAVGYGAHVFLSKPIPHAFAANDANLGTRFGGLPYFNKPTVQLPDELSGPVSLPPLNATEHAASAYDTNGSREAQLPPVQLPSAERKSAPTGSARTGALDPNATGSGMPTATQLPPANQLIPTYGNQSYQAHSATPPPEAGSIPIPAIDQAKATVPPGLATSQLASHTEFGNQLPSNRFEEVWQDAQSKLQRGQVVDVLLSLSMAYRDSSLTSEQKDRLIPLLDQLAGSVVYSSDVHMDAPYVVKGGDTLASIAAENRISAEFVMRANQLPSPELVPGQQLKLVHGPFRAELSVARRELTMYVGRYYAGRFPVAVGRDFPTNLNMLDVSEILAAREYVDPRTGERIAAGDPNNPYGETWIGLRSSQAPELHNLGFHGCGSAVGASDTRGCLSLNPRDVDDLRAILTIGSIVEVVP